MTEKETPYPDTDNSDWGDACSLWHIAQSLPRHIYNGRPWCNLKTEWHIIISNSMWPNIDTKGSYKILVIPIYM
jgi:hypothetical protein